MVMCFTGCGENKTEKHTAVESTEEEARDTEKSAEEEAKEAKNSVGEEKQLQIRRLKAVELEDDPEAKLPYDIVMYADATEAFKESVEIHMEGSKKGKILFSFTKSEDFSLIMVHNGLIVEENKTCEGCSVANIEEVGNIQTFSLTPPSVEEPVTVVYELKLDGADNVFIAFYVCP